MIDDNDIPPSEDLEDTKSPGSKENEADDSLTTNDKDEQADFSKDSDNDDSKTLTEDERQPKEWEEIEASKEDKNDADELNEDAIGPQKTLDQGEIDSLLEDVYNPVEEKVIKTGTSVLLANKTVYYERLPMLEVVFDRLVRMMSTTFRNFTSTNVEVTVSKIVSMKFGDYLSNIPRPAMLGVFRAEEWDNQGLIFVDSNLIYSIVNVLLGNRRGELVKMEGRPYTAIERHLIERMMVIVMADLKNAFEPITEVNFDFERLEINPDFAAIARENNAVLVAKMRLSMDDRQGDIDVLLPYATIEPVRELLLQNFMGEKFGRDAIWENHLADRLWGTDIEIQAMFLSQIGNLYDVLNWQVGTRLFLNATNSDPVELRCGNHVIGLGKIGQKSGKVSVRLDTLLQGRTQQ